MGMNRLTEKKRREKPGAGNRSGLANKPDKEIARNPFVPRRPRPAASRARPVPRSRRNCPPPRGLPGRRACASARRRHGAGPHAPATALLPHSPDLIDYLIGNGQQLSAIQMTQALKLVDKYPPLPILEGYIKKAKQTALELFGKNGPDKSLNRARLMEINNLRVAHTMVEQQHADSSKSAILEEINNLLADYAKSCNSINASTASNKNSCQQQKNQPQKKEQKSKKRKRKQRQHEEQDRQVQEKQRKLEGSQEQPQEKRQQLPQHKPQESKDQQQHDNKGQQHNAQAKEQKQQQQQIEPQQRPLQHLNQPRPCVTKLATPVGPSPRFVPPAVPSVAQINPIVHQPFAVTPGFAQPRFLGIRGGPLAANGVPPQYNPFLQDPSYLHPSFYPR